MNSNQLNSERSRIDALLANGKINPKDHSVLMDVLNKDSKLSKKIFSLIINPFEKISSSAVLFLVGLFSIGIMSYVGQKIGLHYHGALDFQILEEGKQTLSFNTLFIQNLIDVLTVSVIFFAGAVISKCKNLRLIDFLGSVLCSRFPYFLFSIFLFVFGPIFPELLPRKVTEVHGSLSLAILAITGTVFLTWEIVLLFSALKNSSGLKGKILWINFIVGLVLAEVASLVLNIYILK
ncbi:MAG: hypothetical protein ACXVCP_02380 [Bdellovibrio sp.]